MSTGLPTPAEERLARVLAVVCSIPAGEVMSYGEVARQAGLGQGARLVARVLCRLPDDTEVPWHRVINARGRVSLPADSDAGREQRRRLLVEGVVCRD